MRTRIRVAVPGLPRPVWILNTGMAVNTAGSGLVLPFLLIYLHNVRGFSLAAAGLVPTVHFAVALIFGLFAGSAFDRLGGRGTAVVSLGLLAVGFGAFPLVQEPWHAFVLAAIAGAGRGGFWPSFSGLLAALTPSELRPAAYAVQRVSSNLALGLGSLVAGVTVATSDPGTFTFVFVGNAATSVAFAIALAFVPPAERPAELEKRGSYRDVVRDRPFVALIAVNFVFVTAGIALLNSVLPLFAKNDAGLSEDLVGMIFVMNTVAIVLAQFPLTRALEGRRRMRALAAMGVLWALAWLLALAADGASSVSLAAALLLVVAVVFAIGECIHGVVQGPLVSDLAPPATRGRYMGAWLTTAQLGHAAGPALGAVALAASPTVLWVGAAAVCVGASVAALGLENGLPVLARRSPAPPPRLKPYISPSYASD